MRAQALASDPVKLAGVVDQVSADLQDAVVELVWKTALIALGGAALTSVVILRRRREPLLAAGLTGVLLLGTAGLGAATWRPEALSQPVHRPAGQREQPDRQRRGPGGPLRRLPRLPGGPGRQRRLAVLRDLGAAAPAGPTTPSPCCTSPTCTSTRGVRPGAAGDGAVRRRRRPRHRRHHRLGQLPGEPADRLRRHPRRPVRLHPGQPRLRGHGRADRRAAERRRPGRLGHDGGRPDPGRDAGSPVHPRQEHRGRRGGEDVLVASGEELAEFADRCRRRRRSPWSTTPAGRSWTASLRSLAENTHERRSPRSTTARC